MGMKFEYDENKSHINEQKHGINFDDAQQLWSDENLLEVALNRANVIRIISIRRSRKEEIAHYENS